MKITIKNATEEEKALFDKTLDKMRAEHQQELDTINAAMRAVNLCRKCAGTEKALDALREARSPHLTALRALKGAMLVFE